eukprot:m.5580 g.5580  ORF g.5580 m.5580 type:complete len:1035 (+) comp13558_c0_seq1:206-3310(+)
MSLSLEPQVVWDCLRDFRYALEDRWEKLMDELYSCDVLDDDEVDGIESADKPWEELVHKILPEKPPELFSKLLTSLERVDHEVYTKLVSKQSSVPVKETIVMNEDLVRRVLNCKDLGTCQDLATDLGVTTDESENATLTDAKEATLRYIEKEGDLTSVEVPISKAEDLVLDFEERKQQIFLITDRIRKFCEDRKTVMEELQMPAKTCWLKPDDFNKIKKRCQTGIPALLVAGSTSSGKSTLLNTLLGDDILPVSYNAATSAICEVCYSPTGRKYAEISWEEGGATTTETLDLAQESGRKAFHLAVNSHLTPTDNDSEVPEAQKVCKRAQVFWPFESLQFFSVVDSPGVTEKTGESLSRELTENFQEKSASGFIYVLDATRAGEEAAQAGGLLENIAESFPIPGAALFVLNKWDLYLTEQEKEEEHSDYINIIERQLSKHWRGFTPNQLVKMNSKIAFRAGKLGVVSDDLDMLCKGIRKIVRKGLHFQLVDSLRLFQVFVDEAHRCLSNDVEKREMPVEEVSRRLQAEKEHIRQLKDSLETGKIAVTKVKLETELKSALAGVAEDLRSKSNRRFVLNEERGAVGEMLCRGVSESRTFQQFVGWINSDIKLSVDEILFSLFKDEKGQHFPILSKWLNSAERMKDGGNAATSKGSTWFRRFMTKMKRWFHAIPRASDYDKGIDEVCANDCKKLEEMISNMVKTMSRTGEALYDEMPAQIAELEEVSKRTREEMTEDFNQKQKSLEKYKDALRDSGLMQKEVAEFTLGLDIHEYVAEDMGLPENRSLLPDQMKVKLPVLGGALIKVKKLSPLSAKDLLKLSESSRKVSHECIVKYYGSVWLSDIMPNAIGLLFEDFPSTLAEKIFTRREPLTAVSREMEKTIFALDKVLEGLCYLHDTLKLVHHHIVPENVMLSVSEDKVKIGGMGLPCDDERPLYYAAPEVLERGNYSARSDMYCFGTLLWAVWNGRNPHPKSLISTANVTAKLSAGCIADVMGGLEVTSDPKEVCGKWDDLMKACWSQNPQQRPTAAEAKVKLASF